MAARDTIGPHVAEGVRSGVQVAGALLAAAGRGLDQLRATTAALSDDQARWGLACLAWWNATPPRFEVDDPVCQRLVECGDSFSAIHATVSAISDPAAVRAALSNLAWHHHEHRITCRAAAAAMN